MIAFNAVAHTKKYPRTIKSREPFENTLTLKKKQQLNVRQRIILLQSFNIYYFLE